MKLLRLSAWSALTWVGLAAVFWGVRPGTLGAFLATLGWLTVFCLGIALLAVVQ